MSTFISDLLRDEEGATAIEYALIAGLIAVALVASLTALGTDLSTFFKGIGDKLKTLVPT
ncbi:Flp family type IVb pilin [Xylophilus sp. ASV27]|uniref:Flp family type IVb pilin n=1 Tax=Xylophilus sp. ASV27 TaxID=2795129 RepID=UPI0018EB9AE3|nr:Flp family type IVb pilin [Xylophilus sp. ASV27]